MKSIYPLITLSLLSSLTLSSCNIEDADTVVDMDKRICTFSFTPVVSDYSQGWIASDTIGIFAYKTGTNDIYSNYSNIQYIADDKNYFIPATNENEIIRPEVGNAVDFIAYYPYKDDITYRYIIDLRDQSSQKSLDLLYSNNIVNNASKNIKFVFNHVLSKIIINSIAGDGYTNKDLEGVSITINNINIAAVLDVRYGDVHIYELRSSVAMNQTDLLSEAILLPEFTPDMSITIKLQNATIYEAKFPVDQYFSSNTIYRYNLRINRTSVELSSAEIADWAGINNPPDTCMPLDHPYEIGDLYPIPNDPTTAIGVVCWTKPGTNGREGKIISLDTDTLEWSTSNDYKLGTSISVGTSNVMVVSEVDPSLQQFPAFKWCSDKGNGWYLPARFELHIINEQWISNKEKINNSIQIAGGEIFTETDVYLASSESRSYPNLHAEVYNFEDKGWPTVLKSEPYRIRAVKLF